MPTLAQCLIAGRRVIWLEFDELGNLRAVHDTNNDERAQATPERLYKSIMLPAIVTTESEILYWVERAQKSSREFYYPAG